MRLPTVAFLLLALLLGATPSLAQHKKESHPELGIERIDRPRRFDAIPIQPDEPFVRLYWRERAPDPKRKSEKKRRITPTLRFVEIPRVAPAKEAKTESGSKGKSDATVRDLASWLGRHVRGVQFLEREDRKPVEDYTVTAWNLGPKSKRSISAGWALTFEDEERTLALVGLCAQEDLEEMLKLWEVTGKRLKLAAPTSTKADERQRQAWLRDYERSGVRGVEYRMGVREALVEPWKAEDTDNYIVIYNTKDQPLLRKVLRDLESLREEFLVRFPPAQEVTAVSTVRICKDRDEYIAYGGSARSAGYWNYVTEELVLYDAQSQSKGKRPDDTMTYVVLYHEALHQYIYYSAGQLSPHSWFNEGFGDYFGGADIRSGKVKKVGPNPMRAWVIEALAEGERLYAAGGRRVEGTIPWRKMIRMSKAAYYSDPRAYAQGWSMVYFLHSKQAQKREDWAAILPIYFATLKKVWAKELEHLGEERNRLKDEPAVERAREAAVKAAFEGIDLDELEAAWLEFTRDLDAKRPK